MAAPCLFAVVVSRLRLLKAVIFSTPTNRSKDDQSGVFVFNYIF